MQPFQEVLHESDIWTKLNWLKANCQMALATPQRLSVPNIPARDVKVFPIKGLPPKPGLASPLGQARLLCDLASIELQAMEIGLRTLIEFPHAPPKFREELAEITCDEGSHLRLCLEGLTELGHPWGSWPVHIGLWECLSERDSLLDRILIVHRYLEGFGLDAGETIRRRLSGVRNSVTHKIAARIASDEIGHVEFGSRWYREVCRIEGLDPEQDFPKRIGELAGRLPRRLEPVNRELRQQAGFSESEIQVLTRIQSAWR